MSTSPKTPSSLLRSLGADDSYLDAKLKASAKEAEQRWPLFRALAPTKGSATPTLSDESKRAWEHHDKPAQQPRKPTLTRPGLSGKLAASLEKLANTSAPTARSKALASEAPDQRESPAVQPVASAVRVKTRGAEATDVAAALPSLRGRRSLFGNATEGTATTNPMGTHGLIASTQATTQPGTSSRPIAGRPASAQTKSPFASQRDVQSGDSSNDSLAALFSRVEGKQPTTPEPKTGSRPNSLMRRIGRR